MGVWQRLGESNGTKGTAMVRVSTPGITLSSTERAALEQLVRKRSTPQQLVTRAKLLLAAAQGKGIRQTARELHLARDMVQRWRRRWLATQAITDILVRLADAPRPGAPATYTPEQVCAIVALACERPEDSGVPVTYWTQQALAEEAVRRGIAPAVSQRAVGYFLKGGQPAAPSHARLGLVEAAGYRIGSPLDQLLLLCDHYAPQSGAYSLVVLRTLRLVGLVIMMALGTGIGIMRHRERRRRAGT
jgi:putative transposase